MKTCFVVKPMDGEYTCNKNMETNKKMKSTWFARQFIEVFKARPNGS